VTYPTPIYSKLPDGSVVQRLDTLGLSRDRLVGVEVYHPHLQTGTRASWTHAQVAAHEAEVFGAKPDPEDDADPDTDDLDHGVIYEVFEHPVGSLEYKVYVGTPGALRVRFRMIGSTGHGLTYGIDNLWVDPSHVMAFHPKNGDRVRLKDVGTIKTWHRVLLATLPVGAVPWPLLTVSQDQICEPPSDYPGETATVVSTFVSPGPEGDVPCCTIARIVFDDPDTDELPDGMPEIYAWDVPTWMLEVVGGPLEGQFKSHTQTLRDADDEPIHGHFGLSYSNYLVLPRSVLQSMPEKWQHRFVDLLGDIEAACERHGISFHDKYRVLALDEHGKFTKDPLADYGRGRVRLFPDDEES
jgi:hypothetical protein